MARPAPRRSRPRPRAQASNSIPPPHASARRAARVNAGVCRESSVAARAAPCAGATSCAAPRSPACACRSRCGSARERRSASARTSTRSPARRCALPRAVGEQSLDLAGSFPMVIDLSRPRLRRAGQHSGPQRTGGQHHSGRPARHVRARRLRGDAPAVHRGRDEHDGRRADRRKLDLPDLVDMNPFSGASSGSLDFKLSVRFGACSSRPRRVVHRAHPPTMTFRARPS